MIIMVQSVEFYVGLLIGILGGFLGSFASSFFQAWTANSNTLNASCAAIGFAGLFFAVGLLLWDLWKALRQRDNIFNPAA